MDHGRKVARVVVDGDSFGSSTGNNYIGTGWLVGDIWSNWKVRERGGEERERGGGRESEWGRVEGG